MAHPENVEMVALEVGMAGQMDEETLQAMAKGPALAHAVHPKAKISLLIGGYDEDPRSLWDIPEAADYVRRYALAAGLDDWTTDLFKTLCQDTLAMLLKCGAVREPHPFIVVIS